jgi:xyloglucan-specific endo-beta-1,4-glucanase
VQEEDIARFLFFFPVFTSQAQRPYHIDNMKIVTFVSSIALTTFAIAAPTIVVERADSCGQWDSVETGSYTVYNNLWGESSATSGSQCFGVDGLSRNKISWHTT